MDRNRMERLFNAACDDVFGDPDSFIGGIERIPKVEKQVKHLEGWPEAKLTNRCPHTYTLPSIGLVRLGGQHYLCGKCWHTVAKYSYVPIRKRRRRGRNKTLHMYGNTDLRGILRPSDRFFDLFLGQSNMMGRL